MDLGRLSQVDFPLQESMSSHSRFLTELGHKMLSKFYDTPGNYTSYGPEYTPYIQAALYITEVEEDQFLFHNLVDQMAPLINSSEDVIANMPIEQCHFLTDEVPAILHGEIEKYNLDCHFDRIRDFLQNIDNEIQDRIPGASESLINSIRSVTEGEYINGEYIEGEYMVLLDHFQSNVNLALNRKGQTRS